MKKILSFCLAGMIVLAFPLAGHAFWIWTPETGSWVNPKYDVKATPQEQLTYAQSFFNAQQYGHALREYKKLIKRYPKSREAAEAQFDIGQCYEKLNKFDRAIKEYQIVVEQYPFSELAQRVVERQYLLANLLMEGKLKDSQLAMTLLGTEHRVVDIFKTVIKNDPYGPHAPASQYKIGLYYKARQEFQEARDAFEKTMNDYPDSKWAESARYQVAVSDAHRSVGPQYDQKITNIAVKGFEDFVRTNPDSELSKEAQEQMLALREKEAENLFLIAQFYEKNKRIDSARVYYNSVVEKFTNTSWAKKAAGRLMALIDGQAGKK